MRKAILLAVFLAGCAVTVEPERFTGPNGKAAYTMKCSGLGRTTVDCYRMAGRLCPGGYKILAQSNVPKQLDVDWTVIDRDLTIECN